MNLFSLHCLTFTPRLTPTTWHGQPAGKVSWESLVGKPYGLVDLIQAGGTHTMLPPGGKLQEPVRPEISREPAPWEDPVPQDPGQNFRGIQAPPFQSTWKVLALCTDGRTLGAPEELCEWDLPS